MLTLHACLGGDRASSDLVMGQIYNEASIGSKATLDVKACFQTDSKSDTVK